MHILDTVSEFTRSRPKHPNTFTAGHSGRSENQTQTGSSTRGDYNSFGKVAQEARMDVPKQDAAEAASLSRAGSCLFPDCGRIYAGATFTRPSFVLCPARP